MTSFTETLSLIQDVMLTLFLSGLALIVWGFVGIVCWIVFSSEGNKKQKI